MLRTIFIPVMLAFTSCGQNDRTKNTPYFTPVQDPITKSNDQVNPALAFINAYVDNVNQMQHSDDLINWVDSNNLTTKRFKIELKRTMNEADEKDPELGLVADPIFDAQDNPDKGFELESFDPKTNYVTVKGKDWPEFKLIIRMAEENGTWFVDGCGMVNIPMDKRATR